MQNLSIIGRLGRDASVQTSKNGGKSFLAFSVATNRGKKNETKTYWWDVVAFYPERFENMSKYLTKGSNVLVTGDFDYETYTAQDGTVRVRTKIFADHIEFVSSGQASASGSTETQIEHVYPVNENKDTVATITMSAGKKSKAKTVEADINETSVSSSEDDDLPF